MIELSQLEHFLAFSKHGTLSKAAEELHTSQPALTRSMQKLEEELRVPIFERQKNKMVLNKNGELLLEYANRLINQANDMVEYIRAFDKSQHTISIASCAPAPLWSFIPLLSSQLPDMTISSDIKKDESLVQGLLDGTYQFIILSTPINESNTYCIKYSEEHLSLSVPPTHPLSFHTSIYFKDIDGQNMLLFSNIGFWHDVCLRKMPSSYFFIQNDHFSFKEIIKKSDLPCFISDITLETFDHPVDRISIPILDSEANVTYYLICLEDTKKLFSDEILEIKKHSIV